MYEDQAQYERAVKRIDDNLELEPYRAVLLYEWDDPEHWDWVATAPLSEIISWAQEVQADHEQYLAEERTMEDSDD